MNDDATSTRRATTRRTCKARGCSQRFTPSARRPGQVYCSRPCRERASRHVAVHPPKTGSDLRKRASSCGRNAPLGKETTEFRGPLPPAKTSPEGREAAARARKAERYSRRRTLWKVTSDASCKGCGRALMDPASGVIVAQTAAGTSAVLGLMRCGRVWLCPVCSATIRHKRAEEITSAVVKWVRDGGTAYLVTFTARHGHTDRLADLMDALQGTRAKDGKRRPGAYQRLITGSTWAGSKGRSDRADRPGIRDRIGYIGMIRATEVTVGMANGWHPHIHAIVLVGGRTAGERSEKRVVGHFTPPADALAEWEDHWRATWTNTIQRVNPDWRPSDTCVIADCKCGGTGHGVDFRQLHTERDAQDLGEYLAKTQDGKVPGLELARADLKAGRDGNMAPFELLGRIGDLRGGVPEDEVPGVGSLDWCLARWHEYEPATKGRRAIEWTRYLRQLLDLDGGDTEADDLDLLASADAEGGELRAGVAVTEEGWTATVGKSLDLAVVEAAEGKDGNTDPEAMAGRVREVLALAGAEGRTLTAGEVAEAYDGMLAALAQRREEAQERRRRERAAEESGESGERDRAAVEAAARRAIERRSR